jgi:hypothetical protein
MNVDRWVRQLILVAMVLSALALLITGVTLYAPRAHAASKETSNCDPRGNDYIYKLEGGKPVVLSSAGGAGAPIVGCPEECPPGYETTDTKEESK